MLNTESGYTWSRLSLITMRARGNPDMRFTSLAHLLNVDFLRDCHHRLKKNKAAGIDNVRWEDYNANLDENLTDLVDRLKRKSFKPKPALRVYIPKNEKELRPLGLPAHENKIVELGIKLILEAIHEEDFLPCSHGFRPGRSCHHALKSLNDLINGKPVHHVVEADIKGFFDNVSHELLMEFLKRRIADSSLLFLIGRFLKAGYVDDGLLAKTDRGTPQGSILSPILANIFLHNVLDVWFNTTVKDHLRGFCELVRYADDFVCVVRYAGDARKLEKALKNRFEKHGLQIHPKKSRNISFGRFERENAARQNRKPNTFDFLGFTHYCDVSRKGKFKLGRQTSRKKFVAKCKAMNDWLRSVRNQAKTKEWWGVLKAKLRGHYQYYGVSENYMGMLSFYQTTIRLTRKWLNRRSQKKRMNWNKFNQYLDRYPLPTPRITHSFYDGYGIGS